jgi:hypothetical protein
VTGRVSRLIIPVSTYLCVGTVVAQAMAVALVVATNGLSRDQVYEMLAVAYKVDLDEIEQRQAEQAVQASSEQVSIEAIAERKAIHSLDHDMRERALQNGLDNLRRMQNLHGVERRRYDNLKQAFDARLKQLHEDLDQSSILEVQQTLENIQPKQAKQQLLLMLEDQDAMSDVVAIIKAMPMDQRKKILGEFKTPEESEQLAEILLHIRLGQPEKPVIDHYQKMLDEVTSEKE